MPNAFGTCRGEPGRQISDPYPREQFRGAKTVGSAMHLSSVVRPNTPAPLSFSRLPPSELWRRPHTLPNIVGASRGEPLKWSTDLLSASITLGCFVTRPWGVLGAVVVARSSRWGDSSGRASPPPPRCLRCLGALLDGATPAQRGVVAPETLVARRSQPRLSFGSPILV